MRTWFITGASSGFGRRMTETLLGRGDRVAAAVRRPEGLDDLRRAHGDRLHVAVFDLTDTVALRREVDAAFDAFGRIDVVVSNAGYALFGAAEELGDAQIDRQLATNLLAPIQLIRASLPHLRAQGGGRIVQVTSEGGQVAYPAFSLYHASKWGIEGFVEAVARETAPFGVRFIIAEPGPTSTGFRAARDSAPALEVYADTPAGEMRRSVETGGFILRGDAARTAEGIIAAAEADDPPLRVVLGGTAYENLSREIGQRLEEVRGQRDRAYAADVD